MLNFTEIYRRLRTTNNNIFYVKLQPTQRKWCTSSTRCGIMSSSNIANGTLTAYKLISCLPVNPSKSESKYSGSIGILSALSRATLSKTFLHLSQSPFESFKYHKSNF